MANDKHVEALNKGVAAWNSWRRDNPQSVPDLSVADLHGANLDGADLQGADLHDADLSRANLHGANLQGANLAFAELVEANVSLATLVEADLSGAKLGVATLIEADLSGAKLVKAYLSQANLNQANLMSADLSGAKLENAYLSNANLSHAKLTCADLRGATLPGAYLVDSNLTESNLCDTNLSGADLSGADMRQADMRRATLYGAKLYGAKLDWAVFLGTMVADVDLSEAIGLDSVRHEGRSSIGLDTFFRSKGKIPDCLLRGAGVPEIFLQYASSLADSPIQFFSCFISYSHADKSFARRLHDTLQGKGIRCWLDEKQLLPGDQIHRAVDEAVRLWDKVLLCCSKGSLSSWWVDKEIQKALMKEEQLWKERGKEVLAIIPLNLDGHMFDPKWDDWKKQHLSARLAADFTGWEKDNAKFDEQFERVVRALRADGGTREKPPKPLLKGASRKYAR